MLWLSWKKNHRFACKRVFDKGNMHIKVFIEACIVSWRVFFLFSHFLIKQNAIWRYSLLKPKQNTHQQMAMEHYMRE